MITPQCPGCHAKFSHDTATAACKICGLPDELVAHGPVAIAAWQRGLARQRRPERKQKKAVRPVRVNHKRLYKKLSLEKRNAA